jgi:hypothetical protein
MKLDETLPGPAPARSIQRYSRQAKFCKIHGKPGYRTRRKAIRAAERSRGNKGPPLSVYHCSSCNRFHITSDVERAKAMRAKEAA